MADCDRWQEAISAYADGECSPKERKAVEAHLAECLACREWLEQVTADRERFTEELMGRQGDVSVGVGRELAKRPRENVGWWADAARPTASRRFVEAFAVVALGLVVLAVVFPVFSKSREKAHTTSAASALRQARIARLVESETAVQPQGEVAGKAASRPAAAPVAGAARGVVLSLGEDARVADGHASGAAKAVDRVVVDDWRRDVSADSPRTAPAAPEAGFYADRWASDRVTEAAKPPAGGTTGIEPGSPTYNYGNQRQIKLAYDAGCEVWVKKLQEAVVAAERVFYERGGFVLVSTLDQAKTGKDARRAEVTGKVPTAEAANTINALAELGYVARRDVQGQDLTDSYVTATRDITQTEEKINKLIEKRKNASRAEREWIDAQIADLKQHLGKAQDKTFGVKRELALSTIQAVLIEKSPEPPPAAKGVQSAWRSFVHASQTVGVWLIWLALYGLFLLPVLVGWLIYRRRRGGGDAAV